MIRVLTVRTLADRCPACGAAIEHVNQRYREQVNDPVGVTNFYQCSLDDTHLEVSWLPMDAAESLDTSGT